MIIQAMKDDNSVYRNQCNILLYKTDNGHIVIIGIENIFDNIQPSSLIKAISEMEIKGIYISITKTIKYKLNSHWSDAESFFVKFNHKSRVSS